MKLISVIILNLFILFSVNAQVNTDEEELHEFEDYRSNNKDKLALKTDLASIAYGQIPLIAEWSFSESVSVEGGVFLLYNDWFTPLSNGSTGDNTKFVSTLGWHLQMRYYLNSGMGTNGAKSFIGIMYKYKVIMNKSYAENELLYTDTYNLYTLIWGSKSVNSDNFMYDYYFGIGYKGVMSYKGNETNDGFNEREYKPSFEDDMSYLPVSLQVGLRIGFYVM